MILKKYGTSYHSVELNFESKALTEIGFRRDRVTQIATEEFEAQYSLAEAHELYAEAEGDVQDAVEQSALEQLEAKIGALIADMDDTDVLVIDSEQGTDYPKTRTKQRTVVVRGENRLHFTVDIEPPLRVSIRRRTTAG